MTRIYKDAGVEVIWSGVTFDSSRPDSVPSTGRSGPTFGLVVLPGKAADQLIVNTDALGGAAGTPEHRGRVAYVFYDRVQHIAETYINTSRDCAECDLDNVIVLAHVMAHEIGHLLLPYGHSATGLMRANWDAGDLHRAVYRQLKFTPEQAALIRARLLGAAPQPADRPGATSVAD